VLERKRNCCAPFACADGRAAQIITPAVEAAGVGPHGRYSPNSGQYRAVRGPVLLAHLFGVTNPTDPRC